MTDDVLPEAADVELVAPEEVPEDETIGEGLPRPKDKPDEGPGGDG